MNSDEYKDPQMQRFMVAKAIEGLSVKCYRPSFRF